MNKYDCVVVGSGISGLTAALILGRYGKKVALLEQFSNIAPLLRRFKRADIWCDPGFHYSGGFNQDGPFTILLRYLNILEHIKPIPMDPNGFDIISVNGQKEYKLPYGYQNVEAFLCDHFPKSVKAIQKYIKKLEEINQATSFSNFDLDSNQFSVEVYKNQSLDEFLRSEGAERELIELLGFHGQVLYGSSCAEVPLPVHAYIMGSFYQSSFMILNGGNAWVKAFEKEITKYQIDVYCNCALTGFEIDDNKRVQGVYTSNQEYVQCDYCISTIHPQLLPVLLANSKVRPAFLNRLRRLENTPSVFILFLDVDKPPEKIVRTNYYVFSNQKNGFLNREYLAFMASNHEAESSGKRGIAVITTVDQSIFQNYFGLHYFDDYDGYLNLKKYWTDILLDCVYKIFPEMKSRIRLVEVATPVTYHRYTKTVMGAIYGAKQTVNRRPLGTHSSIRGLYLAGQSIQLGVLGAMISGFMAASNIIDANRLRSEIRACL